MPPTLRVNNVPAESDGTCASPDCARLTPSRLGGLDLAMQDGAEDPQAHLRRRMAIEWFSTDSQCFLNDEPIFWVDRQSPAKTNLKQQSVRPAEQHSSWSEQVVQSRSGTARMTVRPVRNRLIRHLTLSVLSSDTSDFNPKIIMLQERSTTFERQEGN